MPNQGIRSPVREPWVLGQASAATSVVERATGRPFAATGPRRPSPSRRHSGSPKAAAAKAGVELNNPGSSTAKATLREATVKAREGKVRVGEGKVVGQWSFTIIIDRHGVKVPPHCRVGTPLRNE